MLALRYIPAKHDIVPLPHGLEDKIFAACHYFLNQIMGISVTDCRETSSSFLSETDFPLSELNEKDDFIAYCPVRYLYNRTLRENILFGSIKTERQDLLPLRKITWQTFRKHGLLDEIFSIGLQLDPGSQGSRLSGGQQQKIAIARGVLKESPVLILDEATSGLDNKSQARIQDLLNRKYRHRVTVISIIHRLDPAPQYDRIIVMKDGTIIDDGNYKELMHQKGAFYSLTMKSSKLGEDK